MLAERQGSEDDEDDEVFPAGEEAPRDERDGRRHGEAPGDGEASREGEVFPAGVESDEVERPDEKLEDGQPGMADDPPNAG